MSAYYDLYETPDVQNTGEKQPLHARIVPSGTYSQKEFIAVSYTHLTLPTCVTLSTFSPEYG